jgi:hypothetical protein
VNLKQHSHFSQKQTRWYLRDNLADFYPPIRALSKAAQGLGQLEPATRRMTGGKVDF